MFKASDLLWVWNGTELFSLLGPVLLLAGLARAGVLGWYTIGLLVGGVVALVTLSPSMPQLDRAVDPGRLLAVRPDRAAAGAAAPADPLSPGSSRSCRRGRCDLVHLPRLFSCPGTSAIVRRTFEEENRG